MRIFANRLLLPLLLLANANVVHAETYTNPVVIDDGSTKTFTEDTTITVPGNTGLELTDAMGKVTIADGKVMNITAATGISASDSYQTGDAMIILGETHIDATADGIKAMTPANDTYSTLIQLGAGSSVTAKSIAISAMRNSVIDIGSDAMISGLAYGSTVGTVAASNGGTIKIGDRSTIINAGAGDPYASNYNAVIVSETLTSPQKDTKVVIGNNVIISTLAAGDGNHAVKAGNVSYYNAIGKVIIGNGAKISTAGTSSYGLYSVYLGSSIDVGNGGKIITAGEASSAVRAGTTEGSSKSGGGIITIGSDAVIQTSGDHAHGIDARYEGSTIELGKDASVKATGTDASAVYAWQGGTVNLHGGTFSSSDGNNTLYAAGRDDTSNNGATISGSGFFNIKGGLYAGAYAKIDMALNDTSVLEGRVMAADTGAINLSLSENSLWKVTESSRLNNLTIDNSMIDMTADNHAFSTLTVENLNSTGGSIKMDIDASQNSANSDKIYITDTFTGTKMLDLYEVNGYTPVGDEGVGTVLASVKNNNGSFVAKDGEGTLYWNRYELDQQANTGSNGTYTTDWYLKKVTQVNAPTTSVDTIIASNALNYHTWRTENDRLLKRLGELRHNGPAEQGVWFRVQSTKIGRDGKFDFDNKYQTYELGYDKVIQQNEKVTRYLGAAVSYTDGNGSYTRGSGDNNSKGISFYSTEIGSKGHYLDLVLKISDMDNDIKDYDSKSNNITGDYRYDGIALSAEYGRKNKLQKGWYFEPQAQFTLGYLNGDDYTTSNGIAVSQSGIKSVLGRIGFNFGQDISAKSSVYIKANLIHEFCGDYDIRLRDGTASKTIEDKFNDTWFEYGIGAAFAAGKNSHIYAEAERSAGSDFKKDWQWNIGARWTF
ncbi:autotransporter family protein [Phascolarctobacterium sp.]